MLDTIAFNTSIDNSNKKFQRLIIQRKVPESLVDGIETYINDESAFFLHTLDQKLTQKIKNTPTPTHAQDEPSDKTVGLGLYYYED